MSVFASSAGRGRGANTAKMARVRGALEHCSLYLGLAIYIALGAKVTFTQILDARYNCCSKDLS